MSLREIGIADHHVVLSGSFKGTVDFGTGPQTADTPTAFLLSLDP
jgi:hypothetical protein